MAALDVSKVIKMKKKLKRLGVIMQLMEYICMIIKYSILSEF